MKRYLIFPILTDDKGRPQVLTRGKALPNGEYQWYACGARLGSMKKTQLFDEESIKSVPIVYRNLCQEAPERMVRGIEW